MLCDRAVIYCTYLDRQMLNSSQDENRPSARGRRRRGAAHTVPRRQGRRASGSAPPASRSSRAATATSTRPWYESESRGGRRLRLWTDGPPPGPGAGNLAQEALRPRPPRLLPSRGGAASALQRLREARPSAAGVAWRRGSRRRALRPCGSPAREKPNVTVALASRSPEPSVCIAGSRQRRRSRVCPRAAGCAREAPGAPTSSHGGLLCPSRQKYDAENRVCVLLLNPDAAGSAAASPGCDLPRRRLLLFTTWPRRKCQPFASIQ